MPAWQVLLHRLPIDKDGDAMALSRDPLTLAELCVQQSQAAPPGSNLSSHQNVVRHWLLFVSKFTNEVSGMGLDPV